MGDERRWAARYQYLDALWRGRDRIVCDRELEAALHAGVEGSLGELLAGLLPGEAARGQASGRAWMALHNDRRAVSFARERSGTVFVSLDEAAEIASDEPWQVAIVHLEGDQESFLEVLGERIEDDPERSVVLSLDCTNDEDACYERLTELIERLFGDGRIYGLTRPSMAAFYDFGPVLEPEGETADEPDEADIEVDNSLGSEAPRFELFLAVVGASLPSEGVTFVELPAAELRAADPGRSPSSPSSPSSLSSPHHGGGDDELAALRSSLGAQLAEAQRRGDLHAIERQSLLEKLEQAEDRIASLEDQLGELGERDQLGEGPKPAESPAGPRLDELLVREQTQRWELARLRGEIERLEARPVEELEAEVAGLRAELEHARRELELATADELPNEDELDEDELDDDTLERIAELLDAADVDESTPAQAREWRRARSKLDHLLRKLERGGRLSALELHRELVALKRSLLSLGGV